MKRKPTKTSREPSKASLREMPEIDMTSHIVLGRGRHVEAARRSIESVVLDKRAVDLLGGAEGVRAIVDALAKSITASRKKRPAA